MTSDPPPPFVAETNGVARGLRDETARLEAAVADAERRLAEAEVRAAERQMELNDALRREIEAAKSVLADAERQHAVDLDRVHAEAVAEIARLRTGGYPPPSRQGDVYS
ncbi:MAG: hypothetical protein AAFY28_16595 [Actinomycetota bacterium]